MFFDLNGLFHCKISIHTYIHPFLLPSPLLPLFIIAFVYPARPYALPSASQLFIPPPFLLPTCLTCIRISLPSNQPLYVPTTKPFSFKTSVYMDLSVMVHKRKYTLKIYVHMKMENNINFITCLGSNKKQL